MELCTRKRIQVFVERICIKYRVELTLVFLSVAAGTRKIVGSVLLIYEAAISLYYKLSGRMILTDTL